MKARDWSHVWSSLHLATCPDRQPLPSGKTRVHVHFAFSHHCQCQGGISGNTPVHFAFASSFSSQNWSWCIKDELGMNF